MIEVRIDLPVLRKIEHSVTHSIAFIKILRENAGIPLEGVLINHGVTRGTMVWTKEEDLDEESWVIRWHDDGEPVMLKGVSLKLVASGSGQGFTWKRYRDVNAPDEDDEL